MGVRIINKSECTSLDVELFCSGGEFLSVAQ